MRCIIAIMLGIIILTPAVYGGDLAALQRSAADALANGDYPTAKAQLSKALELERDNAYSLYLMALTHLNRGDDLAAAQNYLDRAEVAGAQAQAIALLRARLYTKQNRLDDALTQIESLAATGYGQLARLDDQPDFDRLRENARYQHARAAIHATRFPCEADERHDDFDFWIGDWNVYQGGTYAGQNRITSLLGGCLIFEQWESASGGLGKSFNYFDPSKDRWRQIWVADSGTIIEFTGEARDGGIYYTAETTDPNTGDVTHHRFEFTRHPEGGVRQFWATSNDPNREEWTTIWDGHYVAKPYDEL